LNFSPAANGTAAAVSQKLGSGAVVAKLMSDKSLAFINFSSTMPTALPVWGNKSNCAIFFGL
jgi:hypothetical protein